MRVLSKYLDIIKSFVCYLSIYIIAFIIYLIINFVYILLMGLLYGDFDYKADMFSDKTEFYILIVNCITIFIYYKWYKKLKKNKYFSYERNLLYFDKILLILCGIGTTLMTFGVMNLLLNLIMDHYPILTNEYNKMINSNISMISVINTIATAPLSEELVFRGVILKKAEQAMPFFVANILQSVLFGLFHMNLVMFIYTFPTGLLYGYITARYKSVLPTVCIHILHNAITMIILIITKNQEVIIIPTALWVLITIVGACFIKIFIYNIRK